VGGATGSTHLKRQVQEKRNVGPVSLVCSLELISDFDGSVGGQGGAVLSLELRTLRQEFDLIRSVIRAPRQFTVGELSRTAFGEYRAPFDFLRD